jgi:hypothetical protein
VLENIDRQAEKKPQQFCNEASWNIGICVFLSRKSPNPVRAELRVERKEIL